ncbi:MAG: class I SAM-dependent methyltransferase [Pseudomonadota bacterium]
MLKNKCLVCQSNNSMLLYSNIKGGKYNLSYCDSCGLAQLDPLPSQVELENYYSGIYYPNELDDDFVKLKASKDSRKFLKLIKKIEKHKNPSTLLEVGCSYGFFLDIARDRGWDVYGAEYAKSPAEYAKSNLGLNVIRGGVEEAFEFKKQYDVIVLSHVLEHFTNPREAITTLRPLLKEDGIFIIRTPNFQSLTRFIQDRSWFWLLAPEHIYYFSLKNIISMLKAQKFDVIKAKTEEGDFENIITATSYAIIYRSRLSSLFKRFTRQTPISDQKGSKTHEYSLFSNYPIIIKINYFFKWFSILFLPIMYFVGKLGLGSEIFLIVKKGEPSSLGEKN